MSSSPVQRLPTEVLSHILKQVRNTSSALSFLGCLLCCRRWREVGLPLLYQDIAIGNSNLELFVTQFPGSHGLLIKSLTVSLDAKEPATSFPEDVELCRQYVEDLKRNGSLEAQRLWRGLGDLATTISTMTSLRCFSFMVSAAHAIGFWIPRSSVASIVERLPRTCIALEVDTRSHDRGEPGEAHVCDSLRQVIPRLQHLRLRLRSLCSAAFGTGFTLDGTIEDGLLIAAMVAPALETVDINVMTCLRGYGGPVGVCGTFEKNDFHCYHGAPQP